MTRVSVDANVIGLYVRISQMWKLFLRFYSASALLARQTRCNSHGGSVYQRYTDSGVARICCEEGQSWKLCHGALTVDFRAGCSSCFVTNAVLIKRAVSCWHLHQLISQTTQYMDSRLSDLFQSELKIKLLEVERGHVPQCPIAGDAIVHWHFLW